MASISAGRPVRVDACKPKRRKTVKLCDYRHRFLYTGFLLVITVLHHCHFFKGLGKNKDGEIQSPALLDIADNALLGLSFCTDGKQL